MPDGWAPRVIHPRGFDFFFLFRTKSSFRTRDCTSVRLRPQLWKQMPRCRLPRNFPRISTFFSSIILLHLAKGSILDVRYNKENLGNLDLAQCESKR